MSTDSYQKVSKKNESGFIPHRSRLHYFVILILLNILYEFYFAK